MSSNSILSTNSEFQNRHIGPKVHEVQLMLQELGFSSLEELAKKVIPRQIVSESTFENLGQGLSEYNLLKKIKNIVSENQIFQNFIGLGYSNCITPPVIQRNILENPLWYTAYTPYQPEISQGRMESLLNFQTLVKDLTGMEISNSSLLDEGTAAAEAMSMAHQLCKNNSNDFLVSPSLHPQVIEVLRTRAEPLGLKMILEEPRQHAFQKDLFCVIVSYPTSDGRVLDYSTIVEKAKAKGALMLVAADLLALTLLKPPGEWGADVVFGNSQRFGVPLGFGGPHAAFLSTRDAFKRLIPGRLVGVSVDSQGDMALRLTLQTREQHIRREKATSNICTAQVLLANMAAMYAVYHGPKGLKNIALRTHKLTQVLSAKLKKMGFQVINESFFDTLFVQTKLSSEIVQYSKKLKINFRIVDDQTLGISLDETSDLESLSLILSAFSMGQKSQFDFQSELDSTPKFQFPENLARASLFLTHPVFNTHHSETELLRYITALQNKDITLAQSMIPLGSCTMKLNATAELMPVSWPEINQIHPFAPLEQAQGYLKLIQDLEMKLREITGFAAVSLQPNAGSQGEYAGLLVIRKYLQSKSQGHRKICLIPSSAHGTNPASAVMAGFEVVVVQCDDLGNVDVADLKAKAEKHKDQLGALMITYPSTHGVFEESIKEVCAIVHDCGGQVYMDGANLNALVGICRPGEFGPDVSHMNLHKTFSIPHGGGGPGVGPIGVAEHLKNYLPTHSITPECGPGMGIPAVSSAPWGSASILPISWAYIEMMGAAGLRKATLVSILSANYLAKKLNPFFNVLYKGQEGLVAHECIIDLRPFKKIHIEVNDIAKRLMDFGFHSPTMSWPVAGTLMIEPTESESKPELDRFIEAMTTIYQEIQQIENGTYSENDNPLRNAPHTLKVLLKSEWNHSYSREIAAFPRPWVKQNKYWPTVSRVDNVYGDKHVNCSCPPMENYKTEANA